MRFKPPVFKTCCFFGSVRTGLIAWGWFKLIVDIGLLIFFKVILIRGIISIHNTDHVVRPFRNVVILLTIILSLIIIDLAQHALLICATMKRNLTLLTEYCVFYVIWWIFVAFVGFVGILFTIRDLVDSYSSFDLKILFLDMTALILYLGSQLYIILLVRSEVIELKTKNMMALEGTETNRLTQTVKDGGPHTYEEITDGSGTSNTNSKKTKDKNRTSTSEKIRKTINSITTIHI